MAYDERKKEYNLNYIKEKIKRVPLDMQRDLYEEIKAAADAAGESVNGYIKRAVLDRLERENRG